MREMLEWCAEHFDLDPALTEISLAHLPPTPFVSEWVYQRAAMNLEDFDFDNLSMSDIAEIALHALELLRLGPDDEKCWCDVAIGNPMVKEHSEGCTLARRIIEAP